MAVQPTFPIASGLGASTKGGFFKPAAISDDAFDHLLNSLVKEYLSTAETILKETETKANETLAQLGVEAALSVKFDAEEMQVVYEYTERSDDVLAFEYGSPEQSPSGFLRKTMVRETPIIQKRLDKVVKGK